MRNIFEALQKGMANTMDKNVGMQPDYQGIAGFAPTTYGQL